jgi:hypothetical protein
MKTWEYLVATQSGDVTDAQRATWLDEKGRLGWELVSEVHFGGGNGTRYTFKRPRSKSS